MYKLEGFASYSMTLDFVSIHEMAPTDEMALENWIPNPYGALPETLGPSPGDGLEQV